VIQDDQMVRLVDLATQADRFIVEAGKRRYRRAAPLDAKSGERLNVPVLLEEGDREQFRSDDGSLSASTVSADLDQSFSPLMSVCVITPANLFQFKEIPGMLQFD
jgi:hypothetical protein